MEGTNQFVFSNQPSILPENGKENVEDINFVKLNNSKDILICIRQERKLIGYTYSKITGKWLNNWTYLVFDQEGKYPLESYPWLLADKLLPGRNVVVIYHPNGVRFYQLGLSKPGLKLLAEDGMFHEVNGWSSPNHILLFGSFYPNLNETGVLSRNSRGKIKFHAATKDSFVPDESDPLFVLNTELSLSPDWSAARTDIFVTNLLHRDPSVIGLRTTSGLEFYQFDANYLLKRIVKTTQITKPLQNNVNLDWLFFADLTHQLYQDILHLNSSGLYVYQYNNSQQDYTFLNRDTEFTQSNGWLPRHSDSIILADINQDSRDDLIFTGPQGLTALTFDVRKSGWKMLINPKNLSGTQRYATVVGTLPAIPPAIPQPSVFTQDTDGKLQWAKVVPAPVTASTVVTRETTPSPSQEPYNRNNHHTIPEQITRTTLTEKPILRWSEQWENNFFKDVVDTASGQVRFSLPLIDISSATGWALQLELFYHSQATTSELLGEGWSIPLAQDYIVVDHRGSIYPEEARYYLVLQGRRQPLKLIASEVGIRRFELAESENDESMTIEYHLSDQRWVIEGPSERVIYGTDNQGAAKEALQWSLGWPNWRGPGRAKEHLQPLVIAWFLNSRVAKQSNRALYYDYEQDMVVIAPGKTYTAALRLKTIRDDRQLRFVLDYAAKPKDEYNNPNPIDDKGDVVFPVAMAHSHYLQGFNLTTADYTQTLQFIYKIDHGKRLLTAIQQPFVTQREVMLECSYQCLLEKSLLKTCSFPAGLTAKFSYEAVIPSPGKVVLDNVLSYPIREKAKIAYGSDYAIMAYHDLTPTAGKVILQIMNRGMTKITEDCSGNEKFLCPSALHSATEDYTLHAYHDFFVVIVESKQTRKLNFFARRDKIWLSEPSLTRSVSKAALIRFSDLVIVVADPHDSSLKVLERIDDQSGWAPVTTIGFNRPLTRLAVHNRLIVGFDDHQIWLVYRDSNSTWKRKRLESENGLEEVIKRFDLDAKSHKSLLEALNHNGLQIFNNFILFNSLHITHGGQINSKIHLFLLDDRYHVMKKQTNNIRQENLYELNHEISQEGSNYKLVYFKDVNRFKVKIIKISGILVEDIKAIGNKNKKQDAMDARIKQLNESDGWKQLFRSMILFNPQRYFIQISQRGAYCGNDTYLRITGTDWERESVPTDKSIPLGNHFLFKPSDDNKLFKLYAQVGNKNRQGQLLRELKLHSPGQIANRYPAYIAYQATEDSVRVLTFKDERTVGQVHTLNHEQLLLESDWQNLVTVASTTTMVHTESQEFRIRPLFMLTRSDKPKLFVSKLGLTDGEIQRITGYQHKFGKSGLTTSETVIVTPAANKIRSGWYESTRSYQVMGGIVNTTEQWFDAEGKPVLAPLEQQSAAQTSNQTDSTPATSFTQLFDREGKWLISDFTPYSLADEMVAYYGFESYEINQIGKRNSTGKTWRSVDTKVVEKGFTFTGENYLQLNHKGFLEGTLEPRDQTMTYLASCWIRSDTPFVPNTPTSHFKAIIGTTQGQEVIGLQAQIKRQSGDWSYLELPIDLLLVKQIYQDFYHFSHATASISTSVIALPSPDEARFSVTLRVSAEQQQIIDLDHIRFSPQSLDFKAMIYHPVTGHTIDILQANGLRTKTLYNRLQQDIAGLQEDGQLERFSSSSRTGKLAPIPVGIITNHMPASLTFEPEQGFYETFDAYALSNRWKVNSPGAWKIAPGQLWHRKLGKNRIQANSRIFHSRTAAFRCYFALQESQASLSLDWKGVGSIQVTRDSGGVGTLALTNGQSFSPLPVAGELIVMLDKNYVWLWFDSVLLLEHELSISTTDKSIKPWSDFSLEANSQVLVEDCLVMNNPQLRIEYKNSFGEKTQVIQLVNTDTVLVTDTLYDELGREAITSKTTRVLRTAGEPLLAYRPHFASNKNPADPESVWQTGKLRGEVDRLNPDDQGVAYVRTEYAKNPLNERSALGFAGSEFSVTGHYATRYSHNSGIALLDNLFPAHQGYRQTVEYKPNGSRKVVVFDQKGNQVAQYVQVPSYNHLLTTYEYDNGNRLVKILSPLYHEKVGTADKIISWQTGKPFLSTHERRGQQELATFFIYDDYGNLISKKTPDSGTTEYLYNAAGQKRFMVSLGPNNQTSLVTYLNYDANDQLIETGYIKEPISLADLRQYVESQLLPDSQEYQRIDYADDHPDPWSRGRVKQFVTNNEENPVVDELSFNAQQQIVAKRTVSTLVPAEADELTQFTKQYFGNQLQTLTYPVVVNGELFSLVHRSNRLGQLVELGTKDQPARFARFTYNANGHLESEHYQPDTPYQFIRNYRYNSPGFLKEISDPFLTEEVAYTEKGYGQPGYGDGMVMETAFNASWPATADGRWFQLEENDLGGNYSALCINALQRTGYLKNNNQPVKLYLQETETSLPLVCDKQSMARRVAEKQIPRYFGHRYAYGNHQELVKAKYFTDETVSFIDPLQPISFSKEVSALTSEQSKHIWQLLTTAGYVLADQQQRDDATAIGKPGISFFRDTELLADLEELNGKYTVYFDAIKQLVMAAISQERGLSLDDFVKTFLHWQGLNHSSPRIEFNWQKEVAKNVGSMLITKGYLPTQMFLITKVLDKKFTTLLGNYSKFIPGIARVLSQRFSHVLGSTAFDVQSYKIDSNGNHHQFYKGFNRYEFTYRHANQIQSIKLDWDTLSGPAKVFAMQHDVQGNVIQALHRGIQTIEYHPTSQRTTRIQLTDGRTLRFYYDAQGERVLKRVLTATGEVSHETFYLRDEKGRVLVDQRLTYFPSQPSQKFITVYIYGPRGLLGFIRNNDFYSVMTDHAGSVRLVIQSGRVVAAYDYLPYGELMRSFGSDPQVQVMYRFTGQEWDEETGLYNYHARLYDPSIGRFYQPDPQSQYFSPYKYAGNSPVSLIDPDGELAILLTCMVIGAIAGMYIGGAAANNRWNPAYWDYKDSGTWLGIVGGGIAGGLLPVGYAGSAGFIETKATIWLGLASGSKIAAAIGVGSTIALGVGGGYVTTAVANKNTWNPRKWEWDRPHTFNALFQGFGAGSGFFGGIGMAHNYASKLSTIKKVLFLTASYSVGGGIAYAGGVMANEGKIEFWHWDFSNPATWSALVDGFDTGMGWPQSLKEIGRGIGKLAKNPRKLGSLLGKEASKRQKLIAILKNPKHPLYKVTGSVVMAYYMGSSANEEVNVSRWNLASFSTYEGILNGLLFGKDTASMFKFALASTTKTNLKAVPKITNRINRWRGDFIHVLDSIQVFRKKIEYQELMKHAFSSDTSLSRLKGYPDSFKREVEHFLKLGLEQWKNGKSNPPDLFLKFLQEEAKQNVRVSSKKLVEWQQESEQLTQKRREIFPDEKVDYLSCSRATRRRKRSELISCTPKTPVGKHVDNFDDFLKSHAVTTRFLSDVGKNRIVLENSRVYSFSFAESGQGYILHADEDTMLPSDRVKGDKSAPSTVRGYWLGTELLESSRRNDPDNGKIKIDVTGSIRYVFTSELQGCSIYTKYNPSDKTLEIFHHRREFSEKGKKRDAELAKEYDNEYSTILREEDFNPESKKATYNTWATAFIYRDDNNQWIFAAQRITYTNPISKTEFVLHDKQPYTRVIFPRRRRRSISNYVDTLKKRLPFHSRLYIKSDVNQPVISDQILSPKAIDFVNQYTLHFAATSSSSQLQFWPLNLYKGIEIAISYFLSIGLGVDKTNIIYEESLLSYTRKKPEPFSKYQSSLKIGENRPMLVEIEARRGRNIDVNDIFTCGVVLENKTCIWYTLKTLFFLPNWFDDRIITLDMCSSSLEDRFVSKSEDPCDIKDYIMITFCAHNVVCNSDHQTSCSLQEVNDQVDTKYYFPRTKQNNSIAELTEEHQHGPEIGFVSQDNKGVLNGCKIKINTRLSDTAIVTTKSAANKFYRHFWPVSWAKNLIADLPKMRDTFWQRLSAPSSWVSVSDSMTPQLLVKSTHLEKESQWLVTDTNKTEAVHCMLLTRLNRTMVPQLSWEKRTGQPTPQGLQEVSEYTAGHLQGGLLLADLVIRKMTGERYQQPVAKFDPLAEAEERLPESMRKQWANLSSHDNLAADPYRGYREHKCKTSQNDRRTNQRRKADFKIKL